MRFTGLAVETTPGAHLEHGGIAWCGHSHKTGDAAATCAAKLQRHVDKTTGHRRTFKAVVKVGF